MIELPTFEMGLTSGDIFFEFKTSSERPMVLLHSTGDNGDFIKVQKFRIFCLFRIFFNGLSMHLHMFVGLIVIKIPFRAPKSFCKGTDPLMNPFHTLFSIYSQLYIGSSAYFDVPGTLIAIGTTYLILNLPLVRFHCVGMML